MKIVMVEPRAPGFHVYSRVRLPRLGLPQLSAVLKQAGYTDITLYCEDIAPIDLEDLCKADFVGLSTTTSTAMAAYRLGAMVKKRNPKAIVVIGGVHVTFKPDEAFDEAFCKKWEIGFPVCDHVVKGEGEELILSILNDYAAGRKPEPILGANLRNSFDEKLDYNRSIQNIEDLPFPDLDAIVGSERIRIAPITTSRGCPFDCSFCSVIEMFGQRMRYRSVDPDDPKSVIAEMKHLGVQKMRSIFFYDDNFIANGKRAKEFLENMIRADIVPKAWTAQVRATDVVRDRELMKLMQRTNCVMVYVGLESVNPESLKEYNKKQSVEQIVDAIRILKEYKIRTHGMFVTGADEDTVESIRHTADFVIKNDISTVQLMILTPLPGTRYFQQLDEQGRIFDYNWAHYDAHHTVFYPKHMSPWELQYETFAAMKKIYAYGRVIKPVFQNNVMTAFFRYYGHNLIARHLANNELYTETLPRERKAESEYKPARDLIHTR